MSDVPVAVLIPYARFLECRARRFGVVTEVTQADGQRTSPSSVAVSSAPAAGEDRAVRVVVIEPTAEVH